MKKLFVLLFVLCFAFVWSLPVVYQGKLTNASGIGLNGTYDVALTIYDAEIGGIPIAGDTTTGTIVSRGLFAETFDLNLLPPFPAEMWYEIAINDGLGWNILTPRQKVGYQIYSLEAGHSIYSDTAYSALYSDTALFARDAIVSLQKAYEGGDTVFTLNNKPIVIRDTIVGDGGSALRVTGNEPGYNTPTFYAYNSSSSGIAIYCSGHFRIAGNKIMYSNSDWIFDLDQDTSDAVNVFVVRNDSDRAVFSVDETGLARTHAFVAADSIQLGGVWRSTWPTGGGGGITIGDTNFIWNQDTLTQKANFWIGKKGEFGVYLDTTRNIIWSDNFDDGDITDWDTTDYLPGGAAWTVRNPGSRPNYGGCSAPFLIVDDDYIGSGHQTMASAISPVIDLSPYSGNQIYLQFNHYYNNLSSDRCTLFVFDGTNWVPLRGYAADDSSLQIFDISAYAIPNFQIKFSYYDPSNAWAWYWMVDNISIYYYTFSTPAPAIVANGTTRKIEFRTPDGDVVFTGTGLRTPGGAGVVGYNNTTSGLPANNVQAAIDALDASVDGLGSANNYIWNQRTSAQTGGFWINEDGDVEGNLTVGRPARDIYLTVGPGTTTGDYPMYYLFNYSISQALYTEAELGATGGFTATRIGWNKTTGNAWHFDSVWIYIRDTTLTSLTGYINPTTGDAGSLLFLDSVRVPSSNGWFDVTLTTPFVHTAGKNILVTVLKRDPWGSSGPRYSHTSISNMHYAGGLDGGWPTPTSRTTRPDIRFGWSVTAGGGNMYVVNNIRIDGGLHDGVGYGTLGQVLTADGAGNFSWKDLPALKFDTLFANTKTSTDDTVVLLDNFKVTGEIVVDSLQAVGDTIFVDDELKVMGDAYVTGKLTVDGLIDPTGLGLTPQLANPFAPGMTGIWVDNDNTLHYFNGTQDFALAKSPTTVITVALDGSGDFDNIPDAVAYAASLAPGPDNPIGIDVMPGKYEYTPGTVVLLPPFVQLRGKCNQTVVVTNLKINMSNHTQINNITFVDALIEISNAQYTTIYQNTFRQNSYISIIDTSTFVYIYNNRFHTSNRNIYVSLGGQIYFANNCIYNNTTYIQAGSYIYITNNYYFNSTPTSQLVHIEFSGYITLANNYFLDVFSPNNCIAIYTYEADVHIKNNTFTNFRRAISATVAALADASVDIAANVFRGSKAGTVIQGPAIDLGLKAVINSNTYENCDTSIIFTDLANLLINGNDILGLTTGILVINNENANIMDNKVIGCNYGITLNNSQGIVKGNIVRNSGTGVSLQDFSGHFENNLVTENANGVVISAMLPGHSIILNRNEIVNNTGGVADLNYIAYPLGGGTNSLAASFNALGSVMGNPGATGSYNVNASGTPIFLP